MICILQQISRSGILQTFLEVCALWRRTGISICSRFLICSLLSGMQEPFCKRRSVCMCLQTEQTYYMRFRRATLSRKQHLKSLIQD